MVHRVLCPIGGVALKPRDRSRLRTTRIAAAVGKGFALLLGIAGVFSLNLFWVLIVFFICVAATSETSQVVMQAAFDLEEHDN